MNFAEKFEWVECSGSGLLVTQIITVGAFLLRPFAPLYSDDSPALSSIDHRRESLVITVVGCFIYSDRRGLKCVRCGRSREGKVSISATVSNTFFVTWKYILTQPDLYDGR